MKFKKLKTKEWLTIIGAIIIFCSWFVQNIQADASAENEKLKRSQLVIDIQEVEQSLLETNLNQEVRRKPMDTVLLAVAQTKLAYCYMNKLTRSMARTTEDWEAYKKLLAEKNNLNDILNNALKSKDYAKINQGYKYAASKFQDDFRQLDDAFLVKYTKMEDREGQWNWWFRISYIIGSLLLAVSFLIKETNT